MTALRILRIGDRAIGAGGEPFGVLGDPRVIGGALEGDVERHLHTEFLAARHEGVEIFESAEFGMDGVVPAFTGADGVRLTWIASACRQRVVATFTVGGADRVDWRQVEHIEAHLGDGRQALGGGREGPGDPATLHRIEVRAPRARTSIR